jgi:hypothetical protein
MQKVTSAGGEPGVHLLQFGLEAGLEFFCPFADDLQLLS